MSNPNERRAGSRVDVFAQAELRGGEEMVIMEVRNLSAGGVYLVGTPAEYPDLQPGAEFEIVIFGSEDGLGDEEDFNIHCRARVIRVDAGWPDKRPPGFGVTLSPIDQEHRERLSNLLLRASGYRAGSKQPT